MIKAAELVVPFLATAESLGCGGGPWTAGGQHRRLLADLHADGHTLVADGYVAVEAQRNIQAKASYDGRGYLQALLWTQRLT